MSRGKYSPRCPNTGSAKAYEFKYNAKGEIPPDWVPNNGVEYNQELHFGNYDEEGFDSYGYSAYDADGKYAGIGDGVDRLGHTEMEYLSEFTDDEFGWL